MIAEDTFGEPSLSPHRVVSSSLLKYPSYAYIVIQSVVGRYDVLHRYYALVVPPFTFLTIGSCLLSSCVVETGFHEYEEEIMNLKIASVCL